MTCALRAQLCGQQSQRTARMRVTLMENMPDFFKLESFVGATVGVLVVGTGDGWRVRVTEDVSSTLASSNVSLVLSDCSSL